MLNIFSCTRWPAVGLLWKKKKSVFKSCSFLNQVICCFLAINFFEFLILELTSYQTNSLQTVSSPVGCLSTRLITALLCRSVYFSRDSICAFLLLLLACTPSTVILSGLKSFRGFFVYGER